MMGCRCQLHALNLKKFFKYILVEQLLGLIMAKSIEKLVFTLHLFCWMFTTIFINIPALYVRHFSLRWSMDIIRYGKAWLGKPRKASIKKLKFYIEKFFVTWWVVTCNVHNNDFFANSFIDLIFRAAQVKLTKLTEKQLYFCEKQKQKKTTTIKQQLCDLNQYRTWPKSNP